MLRPAGIERVFYELFFTLQQLETAGRYNNMYIARHGAYGAITIFNFKCER